MDDNQDFIVENGVLTRYTGPGGDVTIPDGVAKIGDWAFYGCTGLTGVIIPEGVTEIGKCAFDGCTGLTEVTIPESVAGIGAWAFSGCPALTVRAPAGSCAEAYAGKHTSMRFVPA